MYKIGTITDQVSMDFEEALFSVREQFEYVEIHSLWNKTVEDLSDDEAGRWAHTAPLSDHSWGCKKGAAIKKTIGGVHGRPQAETGYHQTG